MRYRLRTLMIVLAVLPPLLWLGWGRYQAWKTGQDRSAEIHAEIKELRSIEADYRSLLVSLGSTPAPELRENVKQEQIAIANRLSKLHAELRE